MLKYYLFVYLQERKQEEKKERQVKKREEERLKRNELEREEKEVRKLAISSGYLWSPTNNNIWTKESLLCCPD